MNKPILELDRLIAAKSIIAYIAALIHINESKSQGHQAPKILARYASQMAIKAKAGCGKNLVLLQPALRIDTKED